MADIQPKILLRIITYLAIKSVYDNANINLKVLHILQFFLIAFHSFFQLSFNTKNYYYFNMKNIIILI
jgi:hypothetical protein